MSEQGVRRNIPGARFDSCCNYAGNLGLVRLIGDKYTKSPLRKPEELRSCGLSIGLHVTIEVVDRRYSRCQRERSIPTSSGT